jgi:hypothetical protein
MRESFFLMNDWTNSRGLASSVNLFEETSQRSGGAFAEGGFAGYPGDTRTANSLNYSSAQKNRDLVESSDR